VSGNPTAPPSALCAAFFRLGLTAFAALLLKVDIPWVVLAGGALSVFVL